MIKHYIVNKTPKRVELKKKYLIREFEQILFSLKNSSLRFTEPFPPRYINSLYFDSSRYSSINESLSGDSKRIKTRLRWYGALVPTNYPVLEKKYKTGQYSWKKLINTRLEYYCNKKDWYSTFKSPAQINECLIDYLPKDQNIPTSLVSYYRYYFETLDKKFRVTIDKKLNFFDQTLRIKPNFTLKKYIENYFILEIKFDGLNCDKISQLINEISFHPERFSKYCESMCLNKN